MIPGKEILSCLRIGTVKDVIRLVPLSNDEFDTWLAQQTPEITAQLKGQGFTAESGQYGFCHTSTGQLSLVCVGVSEELGFWSAGEWVNRLPEGIYQFQTDDVGEISLYAFAWALGAYRFDRYKKETKPAKACLNIPVSVDFERLEIVVRSVYWVRNMINTPAEDMMPEDLVMESKYLAKEFNATCRVITGDKLLSHNYPAIHAVGRGSHQAPSLVDIRWGKSKYPKLTLIGKGVCFDTGGLNLKLGQGMLCMKKDMGGAAHALALAYCIMAHDLPICLRVLIPAVENAINDKAYHPGDVIQTRAGISVEIGNTDAEGRLILADALTAASEDDPEMIIDMATLTGAQRIALGEDLPAFFTSNTEIMNDLMDHSRQVQDPIWPLPLYFPYMSKLKSKIADTNNVTNASGPYGGAITAALFLSKFVPELNRWVHFDFNAWNETDKSGRPQGGEAMALRALFSYIQTRFRP